jgi:hypothetical protein
MRNNVIAAPATVYAIAEASAAPIRAYVGMRTMSSATVQMKPAANDTELVHRACHAGCPQTAREGPEPVRGGPVEGGSRADRRLAAHELDENDEESDRGERATDRRSLHPHELHEDRHDEDKRQDCRTRGYEDDGSNPNGGHESHHWAD